jgi:hypothetical protein
MEFCTPLPVTFYVILAMLLVVRILFPNNISILLFLSLSLNFTMEDGNLLLHLTPSRPHSFNGLHCYFQLNQYPLP